jgi:hypothetical protein
VLWRNGSEACMSVPVPWGLTLYFRFLVFFNS